LTTFFSIILQFQLIADLLKSRCCKSSETSSECLSMNGIDSNILNNLNEEEMMIYNNRTSNTVGSTTLHNRDTIRSSSSRNDGSGSSNGSCSGDCIYHQSQHAVNDNTNRNTNTCVSHHSNMSTDSGYQSRFCFGSVFNEADRDSEHRCSSCSVFGNGCHALHLNDINNGGVYNNSNNKRNNDGTTTVPREQFEKMLKNFLNEYVRMKTENEVLRGQLTKTKSNQSNRCMINDNLQKTTIEESN
jgi:hypothetical protein